MIIFQFCKFVSEKPREELQEENKNGASFGLALILLFFSKETAELDCLKLVGNFISSAGGLKKKILKFPSVEKENRYRKPREPALNSAVLILKLSFFDKPFKKIA